MGILNRLTAQRRAAEAGYQGLMRAALDPVLFEKSGIPDTFDGRAGAVTALLAVACVRLGAVDGPAGGRLAEALSRRVLDGFDAAYREKGVGDHSIARKVRTLAEHHSGLGRALVAALAPSEDRAGAVHAVLRRNGLAPEQNDSLSRHLVALADQQAAQPDAEILAGSFRWTL